MGILIVVCFATAPGPLRAQSTAGAALPNAPTPVAPASTDKAAGKKRNSSTTQNQTPAKMTPAEARRLQAEQELKQQEHQRILGVIPNFNTSNIQNAVPLSPEQKFRLAFRGAIDPFEFVAAGALAGWGQLENDNAGYGQGTEGYAKRYGAAYTDSADGVLWGNAIFPILLHEDPRYFRRGTGSFKGRFLYAISTTVWTKNDNGTWGPNYANVLGNITAGGISNLYYPSDNRGVGLTFEGAATVTAEGALGALGVEFWPDISRRLFHKKDRTPAAPAPK
ncbi:MAG: hypothetical protein ACYDC6_06200 [Acidobacteriaceae bacterium]